MLRTELLSGIAEYQLQEQINEFFESNNLTRDQIISISYAHAIYQDRDRGEPAEVYSALIVYEAI